MPGSWPPEEFPNLRDSDFRKTSDSSTEYNCIAWALEDPTRRWDPDELGQYYWPADVPREVEMPAFVEVFRKRGYEPCPDASFEEGFEKIAIYATSDGKPTHATRQLKNGHWTSKLGDYEDIEHYTLDCLNGEVRRLDGTLELYGAPAVCMKRRRP